MNTEQYLNNLEVPKGKIDVVLDTDAFNEVDDQFAISYMLKSKEKLNTKAIYAAPFHNYKSKDAGDGMEKSYNEIKKLLKLLCEDIELYKGSKCFLPNEETLVDSPASRDLVKRAESYSPENPLYVIAIGAITNIASALLLNPDIAENIVVVWLGGHAHHFTDTREFNMRQDFAAARVVMNSRAPFIQLPCKGVVSEFRISKPDLEYWLLGKNKVADYLAKNAMSFADSYAKDTPWTRVVWDVTAVGWLLNENDRFMSSRITKLRLPEYDGFYSEKTEDKLIRYVYHINRDALMQDLIYKLLD